MKCREISPFADQNVFNNKIIRNYFLSMLTDRCTGLFFTRNSAEYKKKLVTAVTWNGQSNRKNRINSLTMPAY